MVQLPNPTSVPAFSWSVLFPVVTGWFSWEADSELSVVCLRFMTGCSRSVPTPVGGRKGKCDAAGGEVRLQGSLHDSPWAVRNSKTP